MRCTSWVPRGVLAALALVALLGTTGDLSPLPAAADGKAATPPGGPVDINKADETALAKVPGIGPTLAKRIVEFREKHGPFRRVEDLMKVRGIGEKSFEKLRPHLTVGGKK